MCLANTTTNPQHSLGSRTFTIVVGAEKKHFSLHEDLLKRHSEYFHAAIDGPFEESSARRVQLPDNCSVDAFAIFAQFIYTGKIFIKIGTLPTEARDHEYDQIVEAWQLGDYILSISFKDAVVDALYAKIHKDDVHDIELHEVLYPLSSEMSGVRKLLIDQVVSGWEMADLKMVKEKHGKLHELFFDVAAAVIAKRQYGVTPGSVGKPKGCEYHEHMERMGERCYKEMFPA